MPLRYARYFSKLFSFLKKPKIIKQNIESQSLPSFKRKAQSNSYKIESFERWLYTDHVENVENALIKMRSFLPHLVLFDETNEARFSLRYIVASYGFIIQSIQRERTQYIKKGGRTYWSPELEKQKSDEFKKKLGMHPAEFLLSEFIWLHAKEIREGKQVLLAFDPHEKPHIILQNYKPLLQRFFKVKYTTEGKTIKRDNIPLVYELNLNKKRVREILGIK